MIVTAALAWFDEPLSQLEECIRGLPTIADRVVAVDGGYSRYPGAAAASPTEQADVIRETAEEAGLACEIHVPDEVWRGQVEKRSFLLQHAARDTDWFMAVDADHVWQGPREVIRRELATTNASVDGLTVPMFTPMNHARPLEESAAGEWHEKHADQRMSPQRVFRAFPNVLVERYHWWYSAEKNGRRIWLWGGDGRRPSARIRPMRSPMLVEHRCLFREPLQIERNREFCEDRIAIVRETGQEDDIRVVTAA